MTTMSEKELIARGAECVTGDLILNRKVVGQYRNGAFLITADGLAELEVIEVRVKPAKVEKPAKPAKPTKAAKVEDEKAPDPAPQNIEDDMDLSFLDEK